MISFLSVAGAVLSANSKQKPKENATGMMT
jgi:hypothetical protein